MPTNNLAEILKASSFFKGISHESFDMLQRIIRTRTVPKREILFHEEDEGAAIYLMVSGDMQLHKTNAEGKEVVIRIVKSGEVFGEVVLFERDTYPVTATALTEAAVLVIPRKGMYDLLNQERFRNDFFAVLMRKMRYLSDRIHYLSSYDLEERLRMFLTDHFGRSDVIKCMLSKKDVAAAIDATPESLSRLLNYLKRDKVLLWEQNDIRVTKKFWSS